MIARFRFNRGSFFATTQSHKDWSVAQKLCDIEHINFEMMVKCESFMHIDAWFYGLHVQNDKNLFKHSCTRKHSYFRDLLIVCILFF